MFEYLGRIFLILYGIKRLGRLSQQFLNRKYARNWLIWEPVGGGTGAIAGSQ